MASSQSSTSLPQGFSIFQPSLGAQLQFFPAVGTQELDDMINAYMPGPVSIQEKRATVAVDFLEFTQLTGQTFKFYVVKSAVESPFSDSLSSFNASPATSSWDWSQASASSPGSSTSRQPRKSSAGTVSRHQTADFSHLPGMKIMTKDGRDITNAASRGSKTKEQRDHAHLMRIIKACDSCKRKKIRCDPSHKKRSAASQAQPSQSSKVAKKAKAPSQPVKAQQPAASPPILADDGFLSQIPIEWDASFTFNDLEIPDFAMPHDSTEELSIQVDHIPHDYDFFFDPEGYFSSSSSSSASPSKLASPLHSLGDSSLVEFAQEDLATQTSLHSMPVPYHDSAGTVDSYADFNLYSPKSSFSEDEHMVSIEASSERFSTRSVSQSPLQQSQSESVTDPSQPVPFASPGDAWYNDGTVTSMESATGVSAAARPQDVTSFAQDDVDEFYDAQWLCAPVSQEPWRVPSFESVSGRGASNADLMGAYETAASSDGVYQRPHRDQTVRLHSLLVHEDRLMPRKVTHSSTISSGRSSTTTKTVRPHTLSLLEHQLIPRKVTCSSTNSCGRSSTTTEPVCIHHSVLADRSLTLRKESVLHDRTSPIEATSQLRRAVRQTRVAHQAESLLTGKKVNLEDRARLPRRNSILQITDVTTTTNAVSTDVDGRRSVSPTSALPVLAGLQPGGSSSASSSVDSGIVSRFGSPLQQVSDTQQRRVRVESSSSTSTSQSVVNHQTNLPPSPSRLAIEPEGLFANVSRNVDVFGASSSPAERPHSGTTAAPWSWEIASPNMYQHPSVGLRRPVVATLAPLSSYALLCIVGIIAAYAILRSVSAVSLMLPASALSLHTFGAAVAVALFGRQTEHKNKHSARKMSEDPERRMKETPGRLWSGFSDMSSHVEWTSFAGRLMTI
ncbi:hypothetical protein HJFPF1_05273 [Paramyrothecium foliicola]|nr:hypothetical protein HJFPF1_05273 [Paramyrothecium foliicola]